MIPATIKSGQPLVVPQAPMDLLGCQHNLADNGRAARIGAGVSMRWWLDVARRYDVAELTWIINARF